MSGQSLVKNHQSNTEEVIASVDYMFLNNCLKGCCRFVHGGIRLCHPTVQRKLS